MTEVDGKNLDSMSERILMVATKDLKTGRRHVKGWESIEIKKISYDFKKTSIFLSKEFWNSA